MRKRLLISTVLTLIATLFWTQVACAEGIDIVLEANIPLLISPSARDFSTYYQGYSLGISEKVEGVTSLIPMARAGVSFSPAGDSFKVQALGGVGYLWNAAFSSSVLNGDLALLFKTGSRMYLGPHIGIMSFSAAKWAGTNEVTFDKSTGIDFGLAIKNEIGKNTDINFGIDYLAAKFKVLGTEPRVTASSNELDASGVMITTGVSMHF
jgi:hypothetical protein